MYALCAAETICVPRPKRPHYNLIVSERVIFTELDEIVNPKSSQSFRMLVRQTRRLITDFEKRWTRQPTRGRPNEEQSGRNALIVALAELFQDCSAYGKHEVRVYQTSLSDFLQLALGAHGIWRVPQHSRLLRIVPRNLRVPR
jgi:hypothetical protein